jgi:hypothetical protein
MQKGESIVGILTVTVSIGHQLHIRFMFAILRRSQCGHPSQSLSIDARHQGTRVMFLCPSNHDLILEGYFFGVFCFFGGIIFCFPAWLLWLLRVCGFCGFTMLYLSIYLSIYSNLI